MNIVIKMTDALPEDDQWTPVIKLSDEPMKHTGDEDSIYMQKSIND
jgi:nicotinate phosphoribosyltransferase